MESPLDYLVELKDPRVERTLEYLLEKILLIAIAAILSEAYGLPNFCTNEELAYSVVIFDFR